jgi:hypothetical protein
MMEISDVRRRIRDAIERARRQAVERRTRADEAARAFEAFLESTAVPVFRQVANVLRIEGYPFTVFTPSGSVRLMSDRSAEDYIEIVLDTSGEAPRVAGRTRRSRGRRVVDAERTVGSGRPESLTDEDVLAFLAKELEPFVER